MHLLSDPAIRIPKQKMKKQKEAFPPFETKLLSNFSFGDPEARSDDILIHCFQRIKGVDEFLNGSKNIVVGERGAGKSALFKLISDGTLKFVNGKDNARKSIIVPIDDELEYLSILNTVEERFVDKTKRPHGKYKFLWELYILSRVIGKLEEEYGDDLEIATLSEDLGNALGIQVDAKFRMRDLLTAFKVTVL